ncbi:MAG: dihydropyrimidinase [Armatimonadota bacterium]
MDILIKNGLVVTEKGIIKEDIAVKSGKIFKTGKNLTFKAGKIIDAKGKYVFPGFIDAHTHMHLPVGKTYSADDFLSGSCAAAAGGVTTIIDFITPIGNTDFVKSIKSRIKEADKKSIVDFNFRFTITNVDKKTESVLKKLSSYNINNLKVYMVYKEAGLMMDTDKMLSAMKLAKKYNLVFGVHAEDYETLCKLKNKLIKQGKTSAYYHALSRPDKVEADAVKFCVELAKKAKCKLYFVHVSTKEAVDIIRKAQKQGLSIYAETCPQYLFFTKEKYKGRNGTYYIASPPFRSKKDTTALWKAVKDGTISVVATDHCPFSKKQKKQGGGRFYKTLNGLPGVETLASFLYTEGVLRKRISINKMMHVLCSNPAGIFNISSFKGSLKEGMDADMVVFDTGIRKKVSIKNMHSKTDFNPFNGITLTGWPEYTVCRGKIICHKDKFLVKPGYGKLVR